MKWSWDYALGGTGFMIAGVRTPFGLFESALHGSGNLWLDIVFVPVAAVILSIGAYWLWMVQGFYVAERTQGAGPAPIP